MHCDHRPCGTHTREGGAGLLLLLVALLLALVSAGALALSATGGGQNRARVTDRALAQAREALLAYAADRPIDTRVGPGYLPCPDLDDDGWAEATCGSLSGHLGQADRLGRLPWKTLGLPDLRDGHGERLWYAVSTRHKGLLNCAASRGCVDMTPPSALGTITVRDAAGRAMHDGTLADPTRGSEGGAAAVVISPGPPIRRRDGHAQQRGCEAGLCDARDRCVAEPAWRAARCDPRNYLDAAAADDNAGFHDRSDAHARAGNSDGFIQGPVAVEGEVQVNDRIATIPYGAITARVMERVAIELAHCVRAHGTALPPVDPCGTSPALGRVGDDLVAAASCRAGVDEAGWWAAWRPHVLYARAAPGGIEVVDAAGRKLGAPGRFAILVTRSAGSCGEGRIACDAHGCSRALQPARRAEGQDALVASP